MNGHFCKEGRFAADVGTVTGITAVQFTAALGSLEGFNIIFAHLLCPVRNDVTVRPAADRIFVNAALWSKGSRHAVIVLTWSGDMETDAVQFGNHFLVRYYAAHLVFIIENAEHIITKVHFLRLYADSLYEIFRDFHGLQRIGREVQRKEVSVFGYRQKTAQSVKFDLLHSVSGLS